MAACNAEDVCEDQIYGEAGCENNEIEPPLYQDRCYRCGNTALVQSRIEGESFKMKKFMKSELE